MEELKNSEINENSESKFDEQFEKDAKNIYINTVIDNDVYLYPNEMHGDLNKVVENKLKNMYEGKCCSSGFVKKGSLHLLTRKLGNCIPVNFRGSINFKVSYSVEICLPVKGNIISANVKDINLIGFLAENGPMSIVVCKEYHEDISIFDNIKLNDIVNIKVLQSKYKLYDDEISVVGLLV